MARSNAKTLLKARGIPYFEATGCYKRRREPSLVLQDVADNIKTVRQLANWYRQESILLIDANRHAILQTPRGDFVESLGQFNEVTQEESVFLDAWTECNGRYWVAS